MAVCRVKECDTLWQNRIEKVLNTFKIASFCEEQHKLIFQATPGPITTALLASADNFPLTTWIDNAKYSLWYGILKHVKYNWVPDFDFIWLL